MSKYHSTTSITSKSSNIIKPKSLPKNNSKTSIKAVIKPKADVESDVESEIDGGSDIESDIESVSGSDTESDISEALSESGDISVSDSEKESSGESDSEVVQHKKVIEKKSIKKPQKTTTIKSGQITKESVKSKNYLDCVTELMEEDYVSFT